MRSGNNGKDERKILYKMRDRNEIKPRNEIKTRKEIKPRKEIKMFFIEIK